QLAAMAAAGGSEARAVQKEGTTPLTKLLKANACPLADREDAALVLALIGAEKPLRESLADTAAPVALRRRAAESLGLLSRRSGEQSQRQRISDELERWLRSEALDVRVEVELDPSTLDQAMVQGLVEQAQRGVAEGMQQAMNAGQLPSDLGEEQLREIFEQNVNRVVVEQLQQQLWASGQAAGWKEHDDHLPLLQGASRGLQLAVSADLPLFGSGPGHVVPMLTLTALEEGEGLRIRTEVVEVPVWQVPLPGGEQLELVVVPAGDYEIGSPAGEEGRDVYTQFRQQCEGVDVEALRPLSLEVFALVRHPISQGQWRAVVETVGPVERELEPAPGAAKLESLWEQHGQAGEIAVDSVSWNQSQEWLERLNRWLREQWQELGGSGEAPQLALPSESRWEAACRGECVGSEQQATPFHFGGTLDPCWACYDATTRPFGRGRRGNKRKQPWVNGSSGLVNRLGLAELHGQLQEWCADQWHPDPVAGALPDGGPLEGPDPRLATVPVEREMKLLRGGAWNDSPHYARAALRFGNHPYVDDSDVGVRPGCFAPPGSLLGP
ncbi:MAG: formylglycine-generating enzyme family protein, partial [Cyanobium sp.]